MKAHTGTHGPGVETKGSVIHWAPWYDTLTAILGLGQVGALRERTLALARIAPGEAVLDVGCGTGDLTRRAARAAGASGKVIGIDPSAEMIEVARRKAAEAALELDYRLGAVEALALPDGTLDVVLSTLMMHHLPEELKRAGLAEIRRVLRPGGRLVIVDILRPTSAPGKLAAALLMHGGMKTGVQDLSPRLEEAGLTVVETGALGFGLGFVRARKQ